MRKSQLDIIERAEFFRNTKTTKHTARVAYAWTTQAGHTLTFCPFCGCLEMTGPGLSISHCMGAGISDECFILLRRGTMPDTVRKAAATWAAIHRGSGYKYTAEELINEAREKYDHGTQERTA
jgi:hypothetical protein